MRKKRKKKVNVIITIITECAWICLNKQISEYASGPKHAKIRNMAKFSIREHYAAWHIFEFMSSSK